MKPLVSIVIPAYNYERFVGRAIDSALDQDYGNIEVIVVDDGSTDRTADVAHRYGPRVRVVEQANQGLAGARNTGIRESSGDLLFFLDADDLMDRNAISQLVSILGSLPSEFGLVACQAKVMLKDGTVVSPTSEGEPAAAEARWDDLMFGSRFPCTVLMRRLVFDQCGLFDAAYHRLGCEDRDMWLRVAEKFRIHVIQDRLVTVAFHGGNMSADPTRQLAGIRRCLGKAASSGMMPRWRLDFWLKVSAFYHYTATLLFAEAGNQRAALGHCILSLVCYPLPGIASLAKRKEGFRLRRLAVCVRDLFTGPRQPHSSSSS